MSGAVQPFAAFQWAEPADEVLAWEARQPKLLAELEASKADVICLQEVQFEPSADNASSFVCPLGKELRLNYLAATFLQVCACAD
eukprot:4961927-Amphidinium_carterae.2